MTNAGKINAMPITPALAALARRPETGSGEVIGTPGDRAAPFWADPIPLNRGAVTWLADGRLCLAVKKPDGAWIAIGMTEERADQLARMLREYLDGRDRDQIAALAQLGERAKAGEVSAPAEG